MAPDLRGPELVAGGFNTPGIFQSSLASTNFFSAFVSSVRLGEWIRHVLLKKADGVLHLIFTTGLFHVCMSMDNRLLERDHFRFICKFLVLLSVITSPAFIRPHHRASWVHFPSLFVAKIGTVSFFDESPTGHQPISCNSRCVP